MFELKVYLSEDLDKRFRRVAMSVYGYGRGSLSKAAEEAFNKWCEEHESSTSSAGTAGAKQAAQDAKATPQPVIDPDEREKPEQVENGSNNIDSSKATS